MTPRSRNVVVGTVVLVAMIALGWMILQFSGTSATNLLTKGVPFRITADRADGVSEGAPIYYLGVPVGRVLDVQLAADNRGVLIDAMLNPDTTVPANVVGFIRASSSLSMAAAIFLETPGIPADADLGPGSVVKAENRNTGLIPPEFTDLARSVREEKLIANINQTVLEMREQLRTAGQVMASFNEVIGDPKLKEDLRASLASIRTTSENLEEFTGNLETLSGETSATLKQVRTTLADTGQSVDVLTRQLSSRLTQTGELLERFNTIAAKIEKGEGTAGALVNDARLYESLVDTARTLNLTILDLQRLVEQWEQEGLSLKLR